jgi:hypothetical protein
MTIYYAKQLPALSFKPTAPAKLAALNPITFTLEAGSGGNLKVYALHLNDRLAAWSSLADVAGAGTLIATLTTTGDSNAITFTPGPNEEILFWFAFDDAAGVPPALLSFSVPWVSDVTAPTAPSISRINSIVPESETDVGYRVDFGNLPATARHLIVEGQINSGGYAPFSNRAKFEAGTYMKFRGSLAAVEAAGERNEQHLSFMNGLAVGDIVQIKVAAEDDVGNRSAFTESDATTIEASTAAITPALSIEDATLATGATGTIRVHLHGASAENVTVDYASADDTATEDTDYEPVTGTLTFTADDSDPHQYADIAINATGDDPTPGTTAYKITLSGATNATIDKADGVVTINALDYVPVMVETAIVRVDRTSETRVEVSR